MVSHNVNHGPVARRAERGDYVDRIHMVNIGPFHKGGGIGGILKGWMKRSIPVIKSEAKSLGKKLAVTALDTAYEVGRDILVNKKPPMEAVYDQGKRGFNQFQNNFSSKNENPKKAIKRKIPATSISRTRNAKRRRPIRKNNTGFRKVTL